MKKILFIGVAFFAYKFLKKDKETTQMQEPLPPVLIPTGIELTTPVAITTIPTLPKAMYANTADPKAVATNELTASGFSMNGNKRVLL